MKHKEGKGGGKRIVADSLTQSITATATITHTQVFSVCDGVYNDAEPASEKERERWGHILIVLPPPPPPYSSSTNLSHTRTHTHTSHGQFHPPSSRGG